MWLPAFEAGFRRRRAVGLEISPGAIRALVLARSRRRLWIMGAAATPVPTNADAAETARAIHATLAQISANGGAVIGSVGGPAIIIRQLPLPAVQPARILQIVDVQRREFGLLPTEEGVLDVQVLKSSREGASVLAISTPRGLIDARTRLFEQAAVNLHILDVEPLALLNAALNLAALEPDQLLVVADIGEQRAVLCLLSDRGPVVVRYLDVAAQDPVAVARIADEIRVSLAFYRSEYDRESLPRFALSGSLGTAQLPRALATAVGLDAPFEILDPFRVVATSGLPFALDDAHGGPEFVQAFGLALRGL